MSKISLKHSGGNVVSLNAPTNAPTSPDVAFKLPNQDGSANEYLKTDGSGNLSFAAISVPSAPDYVKLTSASGSSGGNGVNIDSLDVSTYKAFEIFITMQPTADNANLIFRFRNGSNSIQATNYVWSFEELFPSGNVSHKSSGSQSKIDICENIGGNSEENVFVHAVMHVATSNDPTGLARQNNRLEFDTNGMTHHPYHRFTRGVGHYSNDTTTYPNGMRWEFLGTTIDEYMYTVYGIKR